MTIPFGVYIHVPFCAARCGYCDFNTYTPGELGGAAGPDSYLEALAQELDRAAAQVGGRRADTVFVGGGTPSLLGAAGLGRILDAVQGSFGLSSGAEVTTEANPESTSSGFFEGIRESGYTRVSLGMQSVSERVLGVLGRRHTPGRAVAAAEEARAAGFRHLNLDIIYGTPGERDEDLRRTLDAALAAGVDHVSAYSLIVEDGTAMARKVRRGELPAPDEDTLARRYEIVDSALDAAGLRWYEVSNWALPGGECRHNEIYWTDGDWWGAGPGAHSHLGGRRFFNLKHPATYARAVAAGGLPIAGSETLSPEDRHTERVMLGLRLRRGVADAEFRPGAWRTIEAFIDRGLLRHEGGRVSVTGSGRLLADGIVTDILLAEEGEEGGAPGNA